MPYVKTIVCLANSRKPAGRCVAGKEVSGRGFGNWIRPVSDRPGEEISEEERRYADGRDPQILDVVEVPLLEPRPHNHQRENHLIDDDIHWVHRRTKTWDDIQAAVDDVDGPLWLNGHHSSRGQNDQVPENEIGRFQSSLYLVRPDNLTLAVTTEANFRGGSRRRVRAAF